MPILSRTTRTRLAVAAAAAACAVVACSEVAVAEDDDLTFEQKMIRNFLGGDRKNLEYRERSPLVIPPSTELPAPEASASLRKSPAWPNDPDRAKQAVSGGGFMGADEGERASGRVSSPDELRRGTVRRGEQKNAVTLSDNESARTLRPSEIGGKPSPSLFTMLKGAPSELETFKEEPVRSRMTEPPAGYRTPSPNQPYAPPKDTGSWFKLPDVWKRGTESER
jgi:hypothetical protein